MLGRARSMIAPSSRAVGCGRLDQPLRLGHQDRQCRRQELGHAGGPGLPSLRPDAPLPVSYTHLRAHETRHDIVCRLLLEKKKKQSEKKRKATSKREKKKKERKRQNK